MSFQEFWARQGLEIWEGQDASGESLWGVRCEDLLQVCEILKTDRGFAFDMLLAVIGVDSVDRFEVLYSFYSTKSNKRLTVKTSLPKEQPCVESLCSLYSSANWHERECFDLLGIEFLNHPNLERILLPKDWLGHPLRKDYQENDERLSWNKR